MTTNWRQPTLITIATSEGAAEAQKREPSQSWLSRLPWSDSDFYGTQAECKAEMKRLINTYENASTDGVEAYH